MTQIVDLGKLRFYFAGEYSSATEYELNDVVKYGGNSYVYINVVKTIGNIPTNTTYWGLMVEGLNFLGDWSDTVEYKVGDAVSYGGVAYIALADNVDSQPDTHPADWTQFVEGVQFAGVYSPTTEYQPNDIVSYGGSTFIALQTTTGNTPAIGAYWDSFASGVRYRGEWTTATAYLPNDIVQDGMSSYITSQAFTSGATFNDDFVAGKWSYFAVGADDILPVITSGDEGKSLTVDNLGNIAWINASGSTEVFYVSPDGNDANPGTSLALPFASIQAAVAAAAAGNATIFVKTGNYAELALPIIVPPNTAIVGDNQRTVNVEPGPGLAADGVTPNNQSMMWAMSNGSILNKMTFKGMTGWVPGSTADDITTSTIKGVVVGFNPASPVTSKSPYVLECAFIGSGAVGAYVDGTAHATGFKSMLFHGYTVISDIGVGYYVKDQGKAEIVSCFTYYCYFGYATSGGGFIRALNGNNSYGQWGATSRGYDTTEVPVTGNLYGTQLQVTTDPISAGFTAGYTVTGETSGATAIVTNLQASAGKVYIKYNPASPAFQAGETINDGHGNTLVIATGGVTGQKGMLLVMNNLTANPQAGASIQIAGDTYSYVIQSVSGTYVDASSLIYVALAQEKPDPSADGTAVTIRYKYSQIRLTGHDFLDIGTGGIVTTNYPNTPLVPPAQGNEVNEVFPGRVYYVSTDQNGNFRVGEYFTVDQGTGTATLNANAFNLSGLTSLRLGSIGAQLGETINEFSSDVTLGGSNPTNLAVPTEYAVKTYVDNNVNTPFSVITTTTTATANLGYFADTTGGAFTLTLPATPSIGNIVTVVDNASYWGTNNLTIARNGNLIMGAASDLTCNVSGGAFTLVYANSTTGWRIL
jgi:hypothetical protein